MGLGAALNAGKTSMFTNQKALEITGNNISNVNTEGYSRQTPVFSDYPSLNFGDFFIGQGVKLSGVEREYDSFVNEQLLDKNQLLGSEDAKSTPLEELERIFSVGDENLATEMDRFFDSWQELSANPSGQVERDMVLQRGEILAAEFNNVSRDLDNVKSNINSTIKSEIDAVNLKLNQVADLNNRIENVESGTGQSANTFRDRRDVLLQELTYDLGVQSFEEPGGTVNVQLPGGLPLVQSSTALQIEAVEKGDDLNLQLNIGGSSFDVAGKNLGGKFSGLMEVRDELVPSLKDDLDYTAYQMAQEVNSLHEAGEGLDGTSGNPFFQNPGSHVSQVYSSDSAPLFSGATVDSNGDPVGATIDLEVDGEKYSVTLDDDKEYSLSELATEISQAENSDGEVVPFSQVETRETDGGYVLSLVPKNIPSKNSYQSVNIDMNELNPLAGEDQPEFNMPNYSDLMSMALQDPSKVAAGETSAPGDNRMALDISALKDKNAVNGEDTFVSFYGKMSARVGIEASQNRLEQSGAEDSLTQLKNMRDGAAGVSLEEEMIALVKYQRGFEASAKLLSTVDDMMGTVISIKR